MLYFSQYHPESSIKVLGGMQVLIKINKQNKYINPHIDGGVRQRGWIG